MFRHLRQVISQAKQLVDDANTLKKYEKHISSLELDYTMMKAIVEAASNSINPVEINLRLNDGTIMRILPYNKEEEGKTFRDRFNEARKQ